MAPLSKQAIAIGLSKARGAGVKAKPGKNGSESTKKEATQDEAASHEHHKPAAKCSKGNHQGIEEGRPQGRVEDGAVFTGQEKRLEA